MENERYDMVNEPPHYQGRYGLEGVDVIYNFLTPDEIRGWLKGNAIKYLIRERRKNHDEDIMKAGWFLDELRRIIDDEQQA